MAKGFLVGAGLGGALSVAAAAGLSLYLGAPTPGPGPYPVAAQRPAQPAPDATPQTTPDRVVETPARRPAAETEIAAPASPDIETEVQVPEAGVTADIDPIAAPEATTDAVALPEPAGPTDRADISVAADVPVQSGPPATAPEAPEVETDLSISTDPAQPPVPVVPQVESGLAAAEPDESQPEATGRADTQLADADVPETAVAQVAEGAPDPVSGEIAEAEPTAATPEVIADAAPAEQTPSEPDSTEGDVTPDTEIAQARTPEAQGPDTDPDAPDVLRPAPSEPGFTETTEALRPSIGTPAASLINRDDAVPTARLPRVGATEEFTPDGIAAAPTSPIERFGAAGQVAPDLPRMAIILIDDGSGPLGADTLGSFPFPLSIALTPGHPDAEGAVAGYRALGFDIMALAEVPEGALATDVEVSLSASLAAVPEAVGVLERPGGSLQSSRDVTGQVAAALMASGHGLVMMPNGLNTAQALVARDGVPSASVFRDFDGAGQDPRVMRRFLDQAAFKARQEGAVVMLGRLQADTISALLLWGLQDRAASVALVPISTVLKEADGA